MTASVVAYNISTVSFRQRLCPPALLGRMNASARFLVWGTMPIGAFIGGVVATHIGIVPTMWIACAFGCLALIPVLYRPLWRMFTLPSHDEGPTAPAVGARRRPADGAAGVIARVSGRRRRRCSRSRRTRPAPQDR